MKKIYILDSNIWKILYPYNKIILIKVILMKNLIIYSECINKIINIRMENHSLDIKIILSYFPFERTLLIHIK